MQDNWSAILREDLDRLSGALDTISSSRAEKLHEGERRRVAVLFLDITGFTSLSEKLDHETVHHLVTGIMGALARVVELHHGYVDKFEGDRIMALFGAKVAAENDSIRAVACGLKMLDTIDEISGITREKGIDIGVRIGIDSGFATVAPDPSGHLTATGNCVNTASRLEEIATVGSILTTGTVRSECSGHFQWEEMGKREVRGLSSPVAVWRPLDHGAELAAVLERSSLLVASPLIGREKELSWLSGLWKKQSAAAETNRRGGAVHLLAGIRGDAGIGKSRLVSEFLAGRESAGEEFKTLHGSTLSFAQPPFQLWSSLSREYLGLKQGMKNAGELFQHRIHELAAVNPDSPASGSLLRSAPSLAEVLAVPWEGQRLQLLDEESLVREIYQAFRNLLRTAAEQAGRLVVVLEDLHWMDRASKEALEFILNNCDTSTPVLFLCTYRTLDVEGPPVSVPYEGFVRIDEIEPGSLGEKSCGKLVCETMGSAGSVPEEVRSFLLSRSEGNPFYLEELISALVESGRLELMDSVWKVKGDLNGIVLPGSITGLMQSRVDLMPRSLKHAIQRASVIGPGFSEKWYMLLSDKLEPGEEHSETLGELEIRRVLTSSGDGPARQYEFSHKLLRDAVYDTLLRHNRTVMHVSAAESLEELYPDDLEAVSGTIAHHWEMGQNRKLATTWAWRAMKRARALYQHSAVIEWSRKLESWLLDQPAGRERDNELLEALEYQRKSLRNQGRRAQETDLIGIMMEIAITGEQSEWIGRLSCSLGSVFRLTNRIEESEECYLRALGIARNTGNQADESYALNCLGALARFQGQLTKALEYFNLALTINHEVGNLDRLASTMNHIGIIYRRLGMMEESQEFGDRAYRTFLECDDKLGQGTTLSTLGILAFKRGDAEEALRCYEVSLDLVRETGDRWSEGGIIGNLGIFYRSQNRLEEAQECYRQAMEIARETGDLSREGAIFSNIGNIFLQQDRKEEALDCFTEALEIARALGDRQQEGLTLANVANLYGDRGERDKALEYYRESLQIITEVGNSVIESALYCCMGAVYLDTDRVGDSVDYYRKAFELVVKLRLPLTGELNDMEALRLDLIRKGVPEKNVPRPDYWEPLPSSVGETGDNKP